MNILVTGGAGYLGSHTCLHLLQQGDEVTILDNLSNSSMQVLERLAQLAGKAPSFVEGDIRDLALLRRVLTGQRFDAVIHFAGRKSVGESVEDPLGYYENNVTGSMNLLQAMEEAGLRSLVFSSSAAVYGDSPVQPVHEALPLAPTSPYGNTKFVIELLLQDLCHSGKGWRAVCLRYFNPVGAHESGHLGEAPDTQATNLMPWITRVAMGKQQVLQVHGQDYPTVDGTGVRDYIHVMDLAEGHKAALDWLRADREPACVTVNLGTGRGTSVLQLVRAFELVSGLRIPYKVVSRRPGDVASSHADVRLAQELFGWQARRDIHQMCADTWRWLNYNAQQGPIQDPILE